MWPWAQPVVDLGSGGEAKVEKKDISPKKIKSTNKKRVPDRSDFKNFIHGLDATMKSYGYLKSRENSISEKENFKEYNYNKNEGFGTRLKTVYCKPMITVKRECRKTGYEFKRKETECVRSTQNQKVSKSSYPCRSISLARLKTSHVYCDKLEKINGKEHENKGCKEGRARLPKLQDTRCMIPSLEGMPIDDEGFSELLQRYISCGKLKKGTKLALSSTKEEKLDDTAVAFPGQEQICSCEEKIVFTGDSSLREVGNSLKKLSSNHRVTTVVIKVKKGNQDVDASVDTKARAKFCKKTPLILTKFGIESICEQVGAHPSLTSLTVERIPLSQPCQAMLVPSFATLRELRLISNRLGDEGVRRLCRFVWRSPQLKVLELSANGIGREGISHLVRMIQRSGLLKAMDSQFEGLLELILNRNPIGEDGFMELLNAAGQDLWLKCLELKDCGLRCEDVVKLTDGRLEVLDLTSRSMI